MKTAALIARLLLGLMFFVFGLNGFLHFLHQPEPTGVAAHFLGAMRLTHYMDVVFAIQLTAGLLLLSGRYTPLALTILAPVIVNILLFHITMAPSGIVPGLVTTALWMVVFASVRPAFNGILQSTVPQTAR